MKILHVINNLGSGGAEKLLVDILPMLNSRPNIDTELLVLTTKNDVYSDIIENKGITIHTIKYNKIFDFRNILEIKRLIDSKKYDLIHSHTFPSQYWVAFMRLFFSRGTIKLVTTEHSTHNNRRDRPYLRVVEKGFYNRYDAIISITKATQEKLLDWLNNSDKKDERYKIVPNGININDFKNARAYNKEILIGENSEKTKLLCMVGRFDKAKDQKTIIESLKYISPTVHLVLVGEGPYMTEIQEYVAELKVASRVHFLGFRDDINRILKTVDIVVLSSLWEGFGLSAVEGMAAGKPVMVSNVEGLNQIINIESLQFEVGNSAELAEKVNILINSDKKYNDMVDYVTERVEKFNIQNQIERIIDIYNELLKN